MKKTIILLVLVTATLLSNAQNPVKPQFLAYQNDHWVDSVFQSLTIDEKIGQLIMVAAYSRQGEAGWTKTLRMIQENKVGGVISMQGTPMKHARMVNVFQKSAKTPLLIAIDGEYGLGMRLDSTLKYPFAITMGAMGNDSLIYQMGSDIGQQCKRLGIHINFAPVADVNSNPNNPVIGFRSFGDSPKMVAQKATAFSRGLESQRILSTAKHFPGHGDTETDSHTALPVIHAPRQQLDSVELVPFKHLIEAGIGGIMTGHLNVPALDESGVAATASAKITDDLLKHQFGFEGIVVSDAMNMSGISGQADAEVNALISGVDLLEFVPDPAKAIASVKKALAEGRISETLIDQKCRKILAVKRWAGLNTYQPVMLQNLKTDLNKQQYRLTIRNSYQDALTVLLNQKQILPLKRLDTLKIATVSIGRGSLTQFQRTVGQYTGVRHFYIADNASAATINQTIAQMKSYNLILASVNGLGILASQNYRLNRAQIEASEKIAATGKAIFTVFGNPYVIKSLPNIEKSIALVAAYQENYDTQELAAQLLFGAIGSNGSLPCHLNSYFKRFDGVQTLPSGRLKFTIPEEVGVDSLSLKKKIDELIQSAIDNHAFPGCQILFAKKGKVFFHESYGHHTYEKSPTVEAEHLYDLASVTKILGPTPLLMWLFEQKKFRMADYVSAQWIDWKGTNKQAIIWSDLLQHQARLRSGLSLWRKALDANGQLDSNIFSKTPSAQFSVRVAANLYATNSYPDFVISEIKSSPLLRYKKYVYSDLGFILLPRIIEKMGNQPYEAMLEAKFLRPLGASTVCYNPYQKFSIDQIAPTEKDTEFRKELLQGFVHDESAALMGGVSGNAGLFGTSYDVAKIMQMYLQNGQYGGERYLSEATIREWTRRHATAFGNRRGYAFDKPRIGNHLSTAENAYPALGVSDSSYGHTGYTGSMVWADPDTGLLFIFLTNRVYPTRENIALNRLKIRNQLQQILCDSFTSMPARAER